MPVIETLKALKTFQSLANFLETGTAADVLADIEFAAARKAFSEIPAADDKRGQVWTCIGHLNSCYEANRHIYANARSNASALKQITWSQRQRLENAAIKCRFLLCLLAFCYAYLGESRLRDEHLRLAKDVHFDSWKDLSIAGKIGAGLWMASYLTPFIVVPLVFDTVTGIGGDVSAYKISDEDLSIINSQIITDISNP
jgi:hypothetical protein